MVTCPFGAALGTGDILPEKRGPGVRTSYAHWQKAKVLDVYYNFESNPAVQFPFTETCKWAFGAIWEQRKGYLTKWLAKADRIRVLTSAGGRVAALARDPIAGSRSALYPDCACEDELYVRFLARRTVLGYPVNHCGCVWRWTGFSGRLCLRSSTLRARGC